MRSRGQSGSFCNLFIKYADPAEAFLNKHAWISFDAKFQFCGIFWLFFARFEGFAVLENHFFVEKKPFLSANWLKNAKIFVHIYQIMNDFFVNM